MSITIRFGVFILLFIACSIGAYAQNLNEQTRRRIALEQDIAFINKQLDSNKEKQQGTLLHLNLLQTKISSRKLLLDNIATQVDQINDSIKKKETGVDLLKAEYERVENAYLQLLHTAYLHRNRQLWVAYLLASDNLRQAYRRWQYFKNYSQYINQKAAQIKLANSRLDEEVGKLKKMRMEVVNLKAYHQKGLDTLRTEEHQSRQMIASMSNQERALRAQLEQKSKDLDKMNKEIARMMATAEKERKAASPKEIETEKALATHFEQNKGKLPWPLNHGVVIEPYGQHNHPVIKGVKMSFNPGVGISGRRGDEVHAVFHGTVKQIVFMPGYSQCVMIQHGSYYTFYCRLGSVRVKTGDTVATGDVLGVLAEIDGSYSLHFELWNGINKQNPELWLKKR